MCPHPQSWDQSVWNGPKEKCQAQKVWFPYPGPPLTFSLWERCIDLTTGNMEWKTEKHNKQQIRFPHFPVKNKEELLQMLKYEQKTFGMDPFCTSNTMHKSFEMMDRIDPDMLYLCSPVVESLMSQEPLISVKLWRQSGTWTSPTYATGERWRRSTYCFDTDNASSETMEAMVMEGMTENRERENSEQLMRT